MQKQTHGPVMVSIDLDRRGKVVACLVDWYGNALTKYMPVPFARRQADQRNRSKNTHQHLRPSFFYPA